MRDNEKVVENQKLAPGSGSEGMFHSTTRDEEGLVLPTFRIKKPC